MELVAGWQVAPTRPEAHAGPEDVAGLCWRPAQVPGTAAGAVGADGRDFDAEDWWFRCRFASPAGTLGVPGTPVTLHCDGIATASEVFLNGEQILTGDSMWAPLEAEVGARLREDNELLIACRALAPRMRGRRRPTARWRSRVVNAGGLRWHRTMVFGRSPGFAPNPAAVGPWRPVRLVSGAGPAVGALSVRARAHGADGVVSIRARVAGATAPVTARLADGEPVALRSGDDGELHAELRLAAAPRWWPHTHGEPVLHRLEIEHAGTILACRRVGFRELGQVGDVLNDGLALTINGVPVFARGAVWTPPDLVAMAPSEAQLRALLERVCDAGMNMIRIPGTAAYEAPAFHDLCDELGILVWQDLMFANLDYPLDDPEFAAAAEAEATRVLAELGGRPSSTVICGNSEVEQQPAMMGLDPGLGRHRFWSETLPQLVTEAEADCVCLPTTPCGGVLPFHPDGGVTHYFGVSGYFMSMSDLRRARVAFASECLAFANIPDEVEVPVHDPRWKQGVPRDAGTGWGIGAGWDFDDVRDHYLERLFGVDPVALRRYDHERYLELGRATTGEVMAATLGEWRRARSGCHGALVLWLKDMVAGAGLGILDHQGAPKAAYHHLRRAMAPIAVWVTDEGLAGLDLHVANDRPQPLDARLRVALYRDGQRQVAEAIESMHLSGHSQLRFNAEAMLGRFSDISWAYRFGPPIADQVVVSLESNRGEELISQCVHFPAGRSPEREPAERFPVVGGIQPHAVRPRLTLIAERFLDGVRLQVPGYEPDDAWFILEPGHARSVGLRATGAGATSTSVTVEALNAAGRIDVVEEG